MILEKNRLEQYYTNANKLKTIKKVQMHSITQHIKIEGWKNLTKKKINKIILHSQFLDLVIQSNGIYAAD